MLLLRLAPLIVTPGLWIAGEADLELSALCRQLDAMGAEPIEDAGGWKSLVVGAEWVAAGEAPAGMVMNLGEVIRRLTERALERSNGSSQDAAKLLGVSRSTMSRWRRGLQEVGIGRKLGKVGANADSDSDVVRELLALVPRAASGGGDSRAGNATDGIECAGDV